MAKLCMHYEWSQKGKEGGYLWAAVFAFPAMVTSVYFILQCNMCISSMQYSKLYRSVLVSDAVAGMTYHDQMQPKMESIY